MAMENLLGGLDSKNDAFNSRFDGRWTEQLAKAFIAVFVSIITCLLGSWWAFMWYLRWFYSKSTINGKKLEFRGTGKAYFKKSIIWLLLSIVTVGIYGIFFFPKRFQEFIASNLYFEGENDPFEYKGEKIESTVSVILAFICLYIAPALLLAVHPAYSVKGKNIAFKANAGTILIRLFYWYFMCVFTFGLYALALPVSINKFVLENTTIEG